MLLHEYHIPKSIKHTVLEFEKFVLINGRIFNKNHLKLPKEGWSAVKFDDLANVTKRATAYSNHVLKDMQHCRTFHKHKWRSEYESSDKHWTERYSQIEFDPEKQMSLLHEFDRDPTVLTSFIHYDHSLWDWNMKRLSVPITLDYICAGMHNGKYKIKALLEHINKMDRSKLIDISYSKEVMDIPSYNASEERNRCLLVEVVLKQEVYDEIATKLKDNKRGGVEAREYPEGYFCLDSDKLYLAVASALGFEAFERPKTPDEEE